MAVAGDAALHHHHHHHHHLRSRAMNGIAMRAAGAAAALEQADADRHDCASRSTRSATRRMIHALFACLHHLLLHNRLKAQLWLQDNSSS